MVPPSQPTSRDVDIRLLLEAAVDLHRAGNLDDAATKYREVLAADRSQADALSLLGQIVYQRGNPKEALELMSRARAMRRDSPTITFNLARLYLELRDWANAANMNQEAARLAPDHPAPPCNLGVALIHLGRVAEGEAAIRKSLGLAPDNALSWSALGLAFARQDRRAEAQQAFEKALALDPALAEAQFNLAEILLGEMDFGRGWPMFAARAEADPASFATGGVMPRGVPIWHGEDLTGKSILVWGEQGLGDQILFAGLIPDLARRARQVVLACDLRLAALFTRSFPEVVVIPQDENAPQATAARSPQVQIALGSLGEMLRPNRAAFTDQPSYLIPDPSRTAHFRARYKAWSGGRSVIGVSWRSSRRDTGAAKSVPIDVWAQLFQGLGATAVSLQYGDVDKDLSRATELGMTLRHDPEMDPSRDLDGQTAQIAALDLVVSVSNTTVHLAGGLGVPVWTFAPLGAGRMWYWFKPATPWAPSPWYPSMRVYHQDQPGQWPPVIERVRRDLTSAISP